MKNSRWIQKIVKGKLFIGTLAILALTSNLSCEKVSPPAKGGEKRLITIVNHEFAGTKQWLPGTIFVNQGDEVTIELINKAPSGPHGFAIPAFGIEVVVENESPQKVAFKADKAGIFPFICHMHPPHVGGQLIVN